MTSIETIDPDGADREGADRVILSYPADLSEWGRAQLETPWFMAYLRRIHETLEPGDVLEEFLDVGCCGDTLDVPLRVEAVDGSSGVSTDTEIVYEEREACGVQGGWRVQSAGGPRT